MFNRIMTYNNGSPLKSSKETDGHISKDDCSSLSSKTEICFHIKERWNIMEVRGKIVGIIA